MENNAQQIYIENVPDNFWQVKQLDKYLEGHNGFIAGGCFKNILSGEKVKDIDMFFRDRDDYEYARDLFATLEENGERIYNLKYENKKVVAFQKKGETSWIELVHTLFGTPKFILDSFDFTVTKMAYFKKTTLAEDGIFEIIKEPTLLYHKDFFEHLYMKRLVLDNEIPFPISTWERSYRYKGYGYNLCRESKQKLLDAIRNTKPSENELSMYNIGGWD